MREVIHFPTRDFLQDVAKRAERNIHEKGRVAGIQKHAYAARLIERYQRRYGPVGRGLSTEPSYYEGIYLGRSINPKGSIRLDLVEGPVHAPIAVYDFKFTATPNPTLSLRRIRQIQSHTGLLPAIPIEVIHP